MAPTLHRLLQSVHRLWNSLPVIANCLNHLVGLDRTPTSIQSLPNELLSEVFSFLQLKPYIICHGVCKKWQRLIPSTQMHPIRKQLLDLYQTIINTPDFEKTLEWTNQNLQPFDREEYIRCLLTQYPAIPEQFRMWILEWPARLVIECIWPGLPFINCRTHSTYCRRSGVNWIAYRSFSPQLSSLEVYKDGNPTQVFIPGLYIWHEATTHVWLIFEQDRLDLFGRVLLIDPYDHTAGTVPSNEDTDYDSDDDRYVFSLKDWICYLQHSWSRSSENIGEPYCHYPDRTVCQPIPYFFGTVEHGILPAPAWNRDECA